MLSASKVAGVNVGGSTQEYLILKGERRYKVVDFVVLSGILV